MLHHGAKRRGLFSQDMPVSPIQNSQQSVQKPHPNVNHPIPFAPAKQPVPAKQAPGSFDVNKYLTMDNAKKVLGYAGTIANILTK